MRLATEVMRGILFIAMVCLFFLTTAVVGQTTAVEYFDRGVQREKAGNLDGAIADYTEAIELDPKFALAYRNRGRVRLLNGYSREAIEDCTKAIELDPKDSKAYAIRAFGYRQFGKLDNAIADLSE